MVKLTLAIVLRNYKTISQTFHSMVLSTVIGTPYSKGLVLVVEISLIYTMEVGFTESRVFPITIRSSGSFCVQTVTGKLPRSQVTRNTSLHGKRFYQHDQLIQIFKYVNKYLHTSRTFYKYLHMSIP